DNMQWLHGRVVPGIATKIARKCNLWRSATPAISQRSLAVRVSVASHALYPFYVLPLGEEQPLVEWQEPMNALLEHSAPRLRLGIPRLQRLPEDGGAALPNLVCLAVTVKAHTVYRALRRPHAPWARSLLY